MDLCHDCANIIIFDEKKNRINYKLNSVSRYGQLCTFQL